ncbi:hypothetical protein CTAYLR_004767 [Chrysophaeum taylorii]|uniref:Serine aminopeptidase S33 domain-containing protein n=1 Tax=Chrysophaeum taylorii TaxID=2483200 RepID=A0AAD7UPD9_9STRA|nr:hypothetical protein CTAYLR_004767 [Chrysophaeum taylorii]
MASNDGFVPPTPGSRPRMVDARSLSAASILRSFTGWRGKTDPKPVGRKPWVAQRLQATASAMKTLVATVPVTSSVASARGWRASPERRQRIEEYEEEEEEEVAPPPPPPKEKVDIVVAAPNDAPCAVLFASRQLVTAPRSPQQRAASTRIWRGKGNDRARLEVAAFAFDRCAEADDVFGTPASSKRYRAKRLRCDGARQLVRAVLSNDVFECDDDDDDRERCDEICRVAFGRDLEERLDFGQVLRWLQHWKGMPRVSEMSPRRHKRRRWPPAVVVRSGATRFRPHAFNEAELDGGSDDEPGAWSRCRVELRKDATVSVAPTWRPLVEDEYDLSLVDATLDARRRQIVLCPRGPGELLEVDDDSGVSQVVARDRAEFRQCGRHPGARLSFDDLDELMHFWSSLCHVDDSDLSEDSTDFDSEASPVPRRSSSKVRFEDTISLSDEEDVKKKMKTTSTTKQQSQNQTRLGNLDDDEVDDDDDEEGNRDAPNVLDNVLGFDAHSASPIMESLGIVDALARAVMRPPRWRAPVKALGPRVFDIEATSATGDVTAQTWTRVDFIVKNPAGSDMQCAYWAPARTVVDDTQPACVIYAHGNSSCRAEALHALKVCALAGVALCALDFAGSGSSAGDGVSLGLRESRDVAAVATHLKNTGVSRVALWGRSMGAVASILTAGERDLDTCCVIADSPFESLSALCSDLVDRSALAALGVDGPMRFLRANGKDNNSGASSAPDDNARSQFDASSTDDSDMHGDLDDDDDDEEEDGGGGGIGGGDDEEEEAAPEWALSPSDPHASKRRLRRTFDDARSSPESRRRNRKQRDKNDKARLAYLIEDAESGVASADDYLLPPLRPRRRAPRRRRELGPFSPSAWLAGQVASAVEAPLVVAVSAKIAEQAKFDVRCLRAGRAAENLGFCSVPFLCVASEDDAITPLSHAESLVGRYVMGHAERRRKPRDAPAPVRLVVCRGDHNAPPTLRVHLAILRTLALYVARVDPPRPPWGESRRRPAVTRSVSRSCSKDLDYDYQSDDDNNDDLAPPPLVAAMYEGKPDEIF